ncbi:DUF5683 domain-containing protein [Bacteroides sp. 519]|uniref:DUF5683 domain-containing protein n=1 Tax=Bacteroides sp. 519 TaxID=2302937 RepID=UPI0013D66C59|nr:DUF5683 domain-containing protein [Bacteroides sp. 519]NDV57219.1 hypothetical protein [Bacteroides sp. 519]
MSKKIKRYNLNVALLFGILLIAGIDVFAQQTIVPNDSLVVDPAFTAVADSLKQLNEANLEELEKVEDIIDDRQLTTLAADSITTQPPAKVWIPDANRATWLAVVFPGGGQIYNRKYWKLPIIYGGFAGCAYALNWNNNMFKDYSQAYLDIMDGDPNTKSYEDLFRATGITEGESSYSQRIKRGKDRFRRYRDMSIFAFIGVYLISIIDAYVDAELSNFDIGPDLSMRIEPTIISDKRFYSNAIGLQWSIRF